MVANTPPPDRASVKTPLRRAMYQVCIKQREFPHLRPERLHLGRARQLLVREGEGDGLDEEGEADNGDAVRRGYAHARQEVVQARDGRLRGRRQELHRVKPAAALGGLLRHRRHIGVGDS